MHLQQHPVVGKTTTRTTATTTITGFMHSLFPKLPEAFLLRMNTYNRCRSVCVLFFCYLVLSGHGLKCVWYTVGSWSCILPHRTERQQNEQRTENRQKNGLPLSTFHITDLPLRCTWLQPTNDRQPNSTWKFYSMISTKKHFLMPLWFHDYHCRPIASPYYSSRTK